MVSVLGELRIQIPDDLHKKLRKKAVEEDKTLKDLIVEILSKSLSEERESVKEKN